MTQEFKNQLVPVPRNELLEEAALVVSPDECDLLRKYVESGGKELSADTVDKFFELFLNGSDPREIHRLNKPFPVEAILWALVKYRWVYQKDNYIFNRQKAIADKVMRAQLEATDLVSDMLVAAKKKHSDKLKKFIQTGNEEDLQGAMSIDSLASLLKGIESLVKITGQDRTVTTKTVSKNEQTVNVNMNAQVGGAPAALAPADAAQILGILANAKRKDNGNSGS